MRLKNLHPAVINYQAKKGEDGKPIFEPRSIFGVEVYAGSRFKYLTFCSTQACTALVDYIKDLKQKEQLTPDSWLFPSDINRGEHINPVSMTQALYKLLDAAGIERKKRGERFDLMPAHALRKYFNTTLANSPAIPYAVKEAFMGHRGGLAALETSYNRPADQVLKSAYSKVIKELEI